MQFPAQCAPTAVLVKVTSWVYEFPLLSARLVIPAVTPALLAAIEMMTTMRIFAVTELVKVAVKVEAQTVVPGTPLEHTPQLVGAEGVPPGTWTNAEAAWTSLMGRIPANNADSISKEIETDRAHERRVEDVWEEREIDPMVKVTREGER